MPRTAYALLLARCGLSQREAADFHRVRPDTVKSWSAGRNKAPETVIAELRELYRRIEAAAKSAAIKIVALLEDRPEIDEIEIGVAISDAEARELGLPCVGAHEAVIGLVIAGLPSIKVAVVACGSTMATVTAIRHREAT